MAKKEIVMPQMGESITSGTITKWHKQVGETIEIDEILFEISTDKVESEIPSPFAGKVVSVLFEEGETIDVGVKIAEIDDDLNAEVSSSQASAEKLEVKKIEESPKQEVRVEEAQSQSQEAKSTKGRFYTPLVRALAKEYGISIEDLSQIKGTGAGGRVNKADFLDYVQGGGSKTSSASSPSKVTPASSPVSQTSGRVEVIPMDNMRKAIARNMVLSKQTSPHVNSIDEVDMTNLVKFREGFKEEFKKEEGFALTYTHFILYAIVQALKEFPMVNASVEGDNIVLKKDINLGCAVAVEGSGLLVPVIKGADGLNITGIARALNILVQKSRSKKLTMDDLSGGTYTFTNNGSFGILAATPVILQPQVGIFCVGTIQKRPVVVENDAIAIRNMMYATHTYDHRIIDGEVGSRFLRSVVRILADMEPKDLF